MRNSFETDAFAWRVHFLEVPKGQSFLLVQSMQEMENSREESSKKMLLQFSSALTRKEKLRGSERAMMQQYSVYCISASFIEANRKCHLCLQLSLGKSLRVENLLKSFTLLHWCCWLLPALQKLRSAMSMHWSLQFLMWTPGRQEQSMRKLWDECEPVLETKGKLRLLLVLSPTPLHSRDGADLHP